MSRATLAPDCRPASSPLRAGAALRLLLLILRELLVLAGFLVGLGPALPERLLLLGGGLGPGDLAAASPLAAAPEGAPGPTLLMREAVTFSALRPSAGGRSEY